MFICYAVVGQEANDDDDDDDDQATAAHLGLHRPTSVRSREWESGVELGLARSQQVSSNTSTASCSEAPLALSSSVTSLCVSLPPLLLLLLLLQPGQVAAGSAHANYFGHNVLILFAFDYFCNFIASALCIVGLPPLFLYASGLLPAAFWASTAAVRGL